MFNCQKRHKGRGNLSNENVGLMRPLPGKIGLPAADYDKIIGKKALTFIAKSEPIYEY